MNCGQKWNIFIASLIKSFEVHTLNDVRMAVFETHLMALFWIYVRMFSRKILHHQSNSSETCECIIVKMGVCKGYM